VNVGDRMMRGSVQLRHAFDFRERHVVTDVEQMTLVSDARHQTAIILTTPDQTTVTQTPFVLQLSATGTPYRANKLYKKASIR